ncbi:hypothetical protein EMGBS15_07590 [Filimonas sp.]|nr:hypothetical protein EMGBS15_07590 [Filimonas sp.]
MIVSGPPSMYFTNVVVDTTPCYGGIGSISLLGGGGTTAYSYSLNTGAFGSTSNWPLLASGMYTIHLKDANGCLRDTVINLIQPQPITISSILSVNASCSGAATGSISVSVTNGTPTFYLCLK